jgi:hypothetical protein
MTRRWPVAKLIKKRPKFDYDLSWLGQKSVSDARTWPVKRTPIHRSDRHATRHERNRLSRGIRQVCLLAKRQSPDRRDPGFDAAESLSQSRWPGSTMPADFSAVTPARRREGRAASTGTGIEAGTRVHMARADICARADANSARPGFSAADEI